MLVNAVQFLEPKSFKDLGATRVKISYGPYLVPAVSDETTHGMKTFSAIMAQKPCGECLITGFLANLIFADGTVANANTGMWLHHTVFFNVNRTDTSCPRSPDRFIAAGNERTPVDTTVGG
jgi:hypothetical protein